MRPPTGTLQHPEMRSRASAQSHDAGVPYRLVHESPSDMPGVVKRNSE
ncbi:hypothetical protein M2335_003303 [Sphingobium sp. B12D2B]|nr:hypothetical protein [Sphingobium sp. B12D2B]